MYRQKWTYRISYVSLTATERLFTMSMSMTKRSVCNSGHVYVSFTWTKGLEWDGQNCDSFARAEITWFMIDIEKNMFTRYPQPAD